jgi:hypothetical protein
VNKSLKKYLVVLPQRVPYAYPEAVESFDTLLDASTAARAQARNNIGVEVAVYGRLEAFAAAEPLVQKVVEDENDCPF